MTTEKTEAIKCPNKYCKHGTLSYLYTWQNDKLGSIDIYRCGGCLSVFNVSDKNINLPSGGGAAITRFRSLHSI